MKRETFNEGVEAAALFHDILSNDYANSGLTKEADEHSQYAAAIRKLKFSWPAGPGV